MEQLLLDLKDNPKAIRICRLCPEELFDVQYEQHEGSSVQCSLMPARAPSFPRWSAGLHAINSPLLDMKFQNNSEA